MFALKLDNLVSGNGTTGLRAVIFTSGQSPESPKEKDILSSDRPQAIYSGDFNCPCLC